jgi:aminopeptidase YwaD
MEHIRVLAEEIGPRVAGTEEEWAGAEYIREELESYGYETALQPFPFEVRRPEASALVVSPEDRELGAIALSPATPGDVAAPLVAAGLGRPEEFPAETVDAVALVERGEIFFLDKVQNAEAAGAAAVIIYDNQPGPFAGQLGRQAGIPSVTISGEDGQALLDLLETGPVTVSVHVSAEPRSGESVNVIAQAPGGECRIVVGGHHDSVPRSPGANDNASGTATVLEMARVLADGGLEPDVCFVLFGAEEIGLLGSAFYVNNLPDEDLQAIEAMLNFDMLAVGPDWPLLGDRELVEIAAAEAERLGVSYRFSTEIGQNVGSDHANFVAKGIPAIIFNCFCDPNYHSPEDRLEFIQEERLTQAGAMGLAVIAGLTN